MDFAPEQLPEDVGQCHAIIGDLLKQAEQREAFIRKLQNQVENLLRHRYGQKADRINPDQLVFEAMKEILRLAEEKGACEAEQAETEAPTEKKKPEGHGRRTIPSNLQRERVEHEVAAQERICKECGREKIRIGEEISERLEYQPARLYVIQDVRPKYACKRCESGVTTAAKPMQPIEKGLPGPGLLAHIVTSKYADHLPLHRLERIFERQGIKISRKTMCDWMGSCAEITKPLYEWMKGGILQSKAIHTDDTPLPVVDPERTRTRTGRLWVYIGDRDHPYTVFDYTQSRRRDGPVEFLEGFSGYLQADAYGGYDGLYTSGGVKEVACWAHTRRKYVDAQTTDLSRAVVAAAWIKMLYRVEEEVRSLSAQERQALRVEKSKPILEKLEAWLRAQEKSVLPKSPIGEAIGYTLNNWAALNRYLEDGDLEIDNNRAERALRGIAIGRKNWLFAGSDRGGRTAAILSSLIATCKDHHVDPFAYLRDVLGRISSHPMRRLSELTPDRWKASRDQNRRLSFAS
jgi:transposase